MVTCASLNVFKTHKRSYYNVTDCHLQDEKELICNLSSAVDGPEALVDADEYLQPKSRAPLAPALTTSSSSSSPPRTPIKTCWPAGTPVPAESPTPQNQQNWDRELMRYASGHPDDPRTAVMRHLNGQPVHHHHGSDSSSSRYCSDPLKMVGSRGQYILYTFHLQSLT